MPTPDHAMRAFDRWRRALADLDNHVYEKGYDGASLQDIADRLGMLKGSLYYYIQSKEDLLFDVISTVHQDGMAALQARTEVVGEPLDRLENAIVGVTGTSASLGSRYG